MNISVARLRWLYLRGAFWWMGLALVLIGIVLVLVGLLIWRSEKGFQEQAVRAVAKVTGKERGREVKEKTMERVYILVYTFADAASGQHEGKMKVSAEDWRRANTGDALTIEYDSKDSTASRRAGTDAHAEWGLLILGGLGGFFASFGMFLATYSFLRPAAEGVTCGP